MRVSKNGRPSLEKDEMRIGNFFVRRTPNHIKITDINSVFLVSFSRRMPIGIWLENIFSRAYNGGEDAVRTLQVFVSTLWSVLSVAPDDEYIQDLLNGAKNALNRHPEWYGVKADATEDEDAEAIQEVKEMREFRDDLRAMAEKNEQGKTD